MTDVTPPLLASRQVSILGSIPPLIAPSLMSFLIFFSSSSSIICPCVSLTPATSVISINLFAPNPTARAPAKASALMLYISPLLSLAIGASTGMIPASMSKNRRDGSTLLGVPTKPRSMLPFVLSFITTSFFTVIRLASCPDRATAFPPACCSNPTIALLRLARTIAAQSLVS